MGNLSEVTQPVLPETGYVLRPVRHHNPNSYLLASGNIEAWLLKMCRKREAGENLRGRGLLPPCTREAKPPRPDDREVTKMAATWEIKNVFF